MEINYCRNCMTKMKEGQEICPVCGVRRGSLIQPEYALSSNEILKGRYLVGRVLGKGGFGITYLGFDLMLNIKVAIKEYFPMGVVNRKEPNSGKVSWNSSVADHEAGCKSFIKEAQKMARIDQIPEIVRVRDVFLTNDTAYIVMDFVEGETLKEKLRREGPMDAGECIRLLLPVMKGMSKVHGQGMIHRDIKPDNIMLQQDGKVRLLDLGAAKEVTLQRSNEKEYREGPDQPLETQQVVSNGFSPPEQYSETGRVGTWTDVYAMCATIYYCITGKVLPSSPARVSQDEIILTEEQQKNLPKPIFVVLQKGLALKVKERIQTMEELEKQLLLALEPQREEQSDPRTEEQGAQTEASAAFKHPVSPKPSPRKKWWKAAVPAALLLVAVIAAVCLRKPAPLAKGTCGENLTWSLSKEGKLTIGGEGDMDDYTGDDTNRAPWYEYRDSITEIEIGEEVTGIGDYAFFDVYHVSTLSIPGKISRLGKRPFSGEFSEITVDEKNEYFKSVDGVLYTADETCIVHYLRKKEGTTYTVPEGVREIGAFAFSGCELTGVELPDTLETIEEYAFSWSRSLGSIVIPSGVKSIGEWAFLYCDVLETVTYQGEKPEIGQTAFENCPLLSAEEEDEIIAEGSFGENLIWSLSKEGKLIIDKAK